MIIYYTLIFKIISKRFNINCNTINIIKDPTLNNDYLKNYAKILQDADKFISNTYSPNEGSFLKMLDNLRDIYKEYLSQIHYVLIVLDDIIENLIGMMGNMKNMGDNDL